MLTTLTAIDVPVHEFFTSTIQGEGYWTGSLSDFIRLHGCPVGCEFCDSLYSPADGKGRNAPRHIKSIDALINQLKSPRVVVTGGEPFVQHCLPHLVEAILVQNRAVSIETSGAFYQEINSQAWLTLSPKMHLSPQYPVKPQMWRRANEIKIIITQGNELDFYEPYLKDLDCQHLYFQPEWNRHDQTLPIALQLMQKAATIGLPFRLSLQTHKFIGVD